MATVTYSHKLNITAIRKLLSSADGPVAKDLIKRAIRVESRAKQLISANPKRVDTGRLRASITWELRIIGNLPTVRIGTNVKYARYVHDGTGIYGPHHQMITPTAKKVMRWKAKANHGKFKKGQWVYARAVRGMQPNPFLRNALKAAGPH